MLPPLRWRLDASPLICLADLMASLIRNPIQTACRNVVSETSIPELHPLNQANLIRQNPRLVSLPDRNHIEGFGTIFADSLVENKMGTASRIVAMLQKPCMSSQRRKASIGFPIQPVKDEIYGIGHAKLKLCAGLLFTEVAPQLPALTTMTVAGMLVLVTTTFKGLLAP